MGRHAAGPPQDEGRDEATDGMPAAPPAEGTGAPVPSGTGGPREDGWLREALVMGGTGAVATGAVLAWAVGAWWVAALGAVGAAVVIVGAVWVARSVPAPGPRPEGPPKVDR
ncbi:hypothetical protein [Actinotalea sp.]|uniref:hypothetical protein n=1 Tax=Actinotalea sp. TaxID=1872145 RepID=UPI003563800F